MKRTINALLIALSALIVSGLALVGCATATAQESHKAEYEFQWVGDYFSPRVPSGAVRVMAEQAEREAQKAQQAQQDAASQEVSDEYYSEPMYGYYEDYSGSYAPAWDSVDGFYSQGVRDGVDSATETYYSSNRAYHYRTPEWTPDEEGYYRDADGYYVVSSDDYAEGEVVQTSKGEGRVDDGGSGSGNFDMYVNW